MISIFWRQKSKMLPSKNIGFKNLTQKYIKYLFLPPSGMFRHQVSGKKYLIYFGAKNQNIGVKFISNIVRLVCVTLFC